MTIEKANKGSLTPNITAFKSYKKIITTEQLIIADNISHIRVLATSGGGGGARGVRNVNTIYSARGGAGGNAGNTVLLDIPVKAGDVVSFFVGAGGGGGTDFTPSSNTGIVIPTSGGSSIVLVNNIQVLDVKGASSINYITSNMIVTSLAIISSLVGCIGGAGGYNATYNSGTSGSNNAYTLNAYIDSGTNYSSAVSSINPTENLPGVGGNVLPSPSGGAGGGGAYSYYGDGARGSDGIAGVAPPAIRAQTPLLDAYGAGGGGGNGQSNTGYPLFAAGAGIQGIFEIWF